MKVCFYWRWVDEEDVEAYADAVMAGFDELPAIVRYAMNETDAYISVAHVRRLIQQYGPEGATRHILGEEP